MDCSLSGPPYLDNRLLVGRLIQEALQTPVMLVGYDRPVGLLRVHEGGCSPTQPHGSALVVGRS
ncbi:MAG: hypothetical protein NZ602_17155 [Thermoguttaceae bacterium]|nr:hypothetical protein [Thermoguttaceae bacterium]MDW8038989.1 hypothetical protein [Thermoguttaceae bacterium]